MIAEDLVEALLSFRREREWERFHTPKNLAVAIAVEAAELLEYFQWVPDDELDVVITEQREEIEHEVADITILLSYLCLDLGIDSDEVVRRKLELNRKKYPAELARRSSKKYDRL